MMTISAVCACASASFWMTEAMLIWWTPRTLAILASTPGLSTTIIRM